MSRPKTKPIRAERRQVAETRQTLYAVLPLDEKIARQEPFRGRQYDKLLALKASQEAAKAAEQAPKPAKKAKGAG